MILFINQLTPGAKNAGFGHFGGFPAGHYIGQISFNLVEKAFVTRQLALLASSIAFYDILAQACTEIKLLMF